MSWNNLGLNKKKLKQHNQPTCTAFTAHFGHKAGFITMTDEKWRFYVLWSHQTHLHSLTASSQVWWTNGKTLATSDGHPCCGLGKISTCVQLLTGKKPASSQPKSLLNHSWMREAVIQQENKLTVFLNVACRKHTYQCPGTDRHVNMHCIIWSILNALCFVSSSPMILQCMWHLGRQQV